MWKFGSKKKNLQVHLRRVKKPAATLLKSVDATPKTSRIEEHNIDEEIIPEVVVPSEVVATLAPKTNRKKRYFWRAGGIIAFACILFVFARFGFFHGTLPGREKLSPRDEVILEVGKQYLLPKGETPDFAVITKANEVRNQPFFQKAEDGDAVLIYMVAKKAILWRPSTKQIIEVGPVNKIESPSTSTPDTDMGTTPVPDISTEASSTRATSTRVP